MRTKEEILDSTKTLAKTMHLNGPEMNAAITVELLFDIRELLLEQRPAPPLSLWADSLNPETYIPKFPDKVDNPETYIDPDGVQY